MGETTPVAHGGNPQDRTGSPRPRCIAITHYLLPITLVQMFCISDMLPVPCFLFPVPYYLLPNIYKCSTEHDITGRL
ncbi:hypothetical protein [Moorena sp. SIO4G3]|uniref:hypothetical protein n=1 Tax=Moorena sp. SIO4G3 TaxID=2607821 RepID=UPI00142C0C0D|nr:hypothetical protein [Moorena sp. SIO4G3]NEO75934.1 hypothetical protein [Moorena sp. SIO4G3]